jgi:hypothetical protein
MEVGVKIPFIVLDGGREARFEDVFFLNKTGKLVRKFFFIKSTLLLAFFINFNSPKRCQVPTTYYVL